MVCLRILSTFFLPLARSLQVDSGKCGDIQAQCKEQCGEGQVKKCRCESDGSQEIECKDDATVTRASRTRACSLLLLLAGLLLAAQ